MKAALVLSLTLLAAIAQVSIAPLFPVRAANFDFAMASLALLMVFAGPRTAMAALPLVAISLGFVTDRSPALLLAGYLPLIPAAAFVADLNAPIGRYAQLAAVGAATGMFVRLVLGLAAVAHGAAFPVGDVFLQLLLPGLFLDIALLTILYFPFRFVGWEPQRMSLRRGGFVA